MAMTREKNSFDSSDAQTEPIPIIDDFDTIVSPKDKADTMSHSAFALKLTSIALGPLLGVNVGIFIAENKPTIEMNFSSATSLTPLNNEASDVASEIANMPIRVDCNDELLDARPLFSEDGQNYITMGQVAPFMLPFHNTVSVPVTMVRESICEELTTFDPTAPAVDLQDPQFGTYLSEVLAYTDAVSTVLHESEHIKQVLNEAEASCYASQKLKAVLMHLGLEEDIADRASLISVINQPDSLMNAYMSEECRPGGAYDLQLGDIYLTKPIDRPEDTADITSK